MNRVEGKRIVVTGGANGLGAAYVRVLHEEGAAVSIVDRDVAQGTALAAELADRCAFVEADVTDPESVSRAFAAVNDALGGIDVLVNNAGIYPHKALLEINIADWHSVIHTNLDSVFYSTRAGVPYLRRSDAGKIINVATNLEWVLAPDMAHYMASKAGVVGFTRGAARELGALGITINALAPGANMPSEELDDRGMNRMREIIGYQVIKRPQFACDVTGPLLFLCSTDSDFITGQVLCVDGGIATH